VPLILDPAPARDLPPGIFKDVAWFTPNQTEAAFYLGNKHSESNPQAPAEVAKKFLSNSCRGVALKMGGHGTYLGSQGGMSSLVPAFSVNAIDTTAAGDAFNAGFATALMLGNAPLDSAVLPSMAEVEEFMKNESLQVAREVAQR
jgi:ribokinase